MTGHSHRSNQPLPEHVIQTQAFVHNKRVLPWDEVRLTRLEEEINGICQRQNNAEHHPLKLQQDLKHDSVQLCDIAVSASETPSFALSDFLDVSDVSVAAREAEVKQSVQLRASDECFRTLFTSINEGFCILEKIEIADDQSLDFIYIQANPAFSTYTGLCNVIGKTIRQVSTDQSSEDQECLKAYGKVCLTGESTKFERTVVTQGRVLELSVFRIEDPTRQRIGVSFTDITERKRADKLLRQNHDTFLNLIEKAPFGLYVVDAQFRLLQVSTASRKVFSNIDPLIGRDFEEIMRILWPETFANEALGRFRHTLETGEPYAAKNTIEKRKNTLDTEAYDWKIERITLPDGQYGVVCYFYDISERQQTAHQLRESEAFSRSIIKSSPDCIKVLDLQGNLISMENGKVQVVTNDDQPFLNTSWLNFWTNEDRQAAQNAIELAVAGKMGNFIGFQETIFGEATWWDVAVSPILDADGKPVRLLVISRDVTQRHEAENVLKQRTAQFETLLNKAPLGILLIDGDFSIKQANPVASHVWPHIPDLIDCKFDKLMQMLWPKALADEIVTQYCHTLESGKPFAIAEMVHERNDPEGKTY